MRVKTLCAVLGVLTVAIAPASALTTVEDPWSPNGAGGTGELNLYQIYNILYGTDYTQTSGSAGAGGMDDAALTADEVFDLLADTDGTAAFMARYAAFEQRFGYYTINAADPDAALSGDANVDAQGVSGDYHHLFDVELGNEIIPVGASPGTLDEGDSPIGFYDTTPLGGANTWYSQSGRNSDGEDHMVAYWATVDGELSDTMFIIAFEDLPGLGDADYNDLVIQIDLVPVPEPATAGLLLMGLVAVVARRRFTA